MLLTRTSKRNIMLFMVPFLVIGALHVLLYSVDFTVSIATLLCGVVTLLWAVTVQKRVTDRRLLKLIMSSIFCLLFLYFLQLLRYGFLKDNQTISRYTWYAMYIPMIAQPILCFYLAVSIYRPKDRPLPRSYCLIIIVGILLMLGCLTNDLHFRLKSFPDGVLYDNGQEKSEWLYYAVYGYVFVLFSSTYSIIIRKSRYTERKYRLMPLVPMIAGFTYFALYPLDLYRKFLPTRIWQIGDMYGFCVIVILEFCIQAGMIPANTGYEILFSEAFFPADILNHQDVPVYRTAAAKYPFPADENMKVQTLPISGGRVEWTVDMEQVRSLNRQLVEATQQLEMRNAYLAEENRIKKERVELETRNRLYEKISKIVQPQFEQIEDLLGKPSGCGIEELAKVSVLSAYIKRRSNMELLAAGGILPSDELTSAVRESLEYINLCGVNTAVSSIGTDVFPAGMVISAYEQIENIVESCLDTLSDLVITIRSEKRQIIVRMMLKADDFVYQVNEGRSREAGFSDRIMITKDRQDLLVVFTLKEGGVDK